MWVFQKRRRFVSRQSRCKWKWIRLEKLLFQSRIWDESWFIFHYEFIWCFLDFVFPSFSIIFVSKTIIYLTFIQEVLLNIEKFGVFYSGQEIGYFAIDKMSAFSANLVMTFCSLLCCLNIYQNNFLWKINFWFFEIKGISTSHLLFISFPKEFHLCWIHSSWFIWVNFLTSVKQQNKQNVSIPSTIFELYFHILVFFQQKKLGEDCSCTLDAWRDYDNFHTTPFPSDGTNSVINIITFAVEVSKKKMKRSRKRTKNESKMLNGISNYRSLFPYRTSFMLLPSSI